MDIFPQITYVRSANFAAIACSLAKKKNQSLRFQHQQIIINYKPQYVPNSYSQ